LGSNTFPDGAVGLLAFYDHFFQNYASAHWRACHWVDFEVEPEHSTVIVAIAPAEVLPLGFELSSSELAAWGLGTHSDFSSCTPNITTQIYKQNEQLSKLDLFLEPFVGWEFGKD
jgi:hypothetical protein